MLGEREFTSEEVAALCGVTRVTVAEWISRGRLAARWTGGGHRRIPRRALAEFMHAQGYEVPRSVRVAHALVTVIDGADDGLKYWATLLGETDGFEVRVMGGNTGTVLAVGSDPPDVLVIDMHVPGFESHQMLAVAHVDPLLAEATVVAIAQYEEETGGLRRSGADAVLTRARLRELPAMLTRVLTDRQRRAAAEPDDRESVAEPPRVDDAPRE